MAKPEPYIHAPEFLVVTHDLVPVELAEEAAEEAVRVWHEADFPEEAVFYSDHGSKTDKHPFIDVDLSNYECLDEFVEIAPTLHSLLVGIMEIETALDNTEVFETSLGRITINMAAPGLRSGKHIDQRTTTPELEVQDRVSRLLYVRGEGSLVAYTPEGKAKEEGSAGSLFELFNPANQYIEHQGFTSGSGERIAVGFQQRAARLQAA